MKLTSLAENFKNKFQYLNDRITNLSNQNKRTEQSSISSFSELHQEVVSLKSDLDKKTNTLLSKTQSVYDKVKSTPDLVRQNSSPCTDRVGINKESNVSSKDVYENDINGVSRTLDHVRSSSRRSEHNT